jgi:oligopeptide transport system ATP-binding protein
MNVDSPPLVQVEDLVVEFDVAARGWSIRRPRLHAVDGVSFELYRGETLALVGESGCGKTTVGRTLARIYRPKRGRVRFEGVDLAQLGRRETRQFRRRVQIVFQDPYSSLNPRMKVESLIAEPLDAHGVGTRAEQKKRVQELLRLVGLPADAAVRFPHAFSGGQRQRIGIARALALDPELVIADEPISALDVSIQAQILNLLTQLQDELGLTVLFIAHDLAVVRQVATRVAVMYLGKLVEVGPSGAVLATPRHPYTQSLLSAVPIPDPAVERSRERIVLRGELPSPISPPGGCRFHTRCPYAMEVCRTIEPPLLTSGDSAVACHLVNPPGDLSEA